MSTEEPERTSISLDHFQNPSDSSKPNNFGSQLHITGGETAEDLIARYNDQFREYKKTTSEESLSLVGEPEDIARNKECRRVSARRMLVTCSLGLWVITAGNFYFWIQLYYTLPAHFIRESLKGSESTTALADDRSFSITGKEFMLINLTSQPFVLGAWGMLGANCGREKVLKAYFVCAPYIMLISLFYLTICVITILKVTPAALEKAMDKKIGLYYHGKPFDNEELPNTAWDRVQLSLKCCGITSKADWLKANVYETNQRIPTSCCRIHHTNKPIPKTDKKALLNCTTSGGPTWEQGCRSILLALYQRVGISSAALNFVTMILTILATANGVLYYRFNMQLKVENFQYTWTDYAWDLLLLNGCCTCRCFRKKKTTSVSNNVNTLVKRDEVPLSEETNVLYKNPIGHNVSETELKVK